MSSGACRALVAVLLTLVAMTVMVLPVAAEEERLIESSTVIYRVNPKDGNIDVRIALTFRTRQDARAAGQWGPVVVEERAKPKVGTDFKVVLPATDRPGPWKAIDLETPRIPATSSDKTAVSYTIDADVTQTDVRKSKTPARVDQSYIYFCALGQDADTGSVTIRIPGASNWKLTQSGTPLTETSDGFATRAEDRRRPGDIFTCIEGTRDGRLEKGSFVGPAGRAFELQAWQDEPGWLASAEVQAEPVLDELHRFIGYDIPGSEPVIIRAAPSREIGGYASAHDTPGIVQLDETGGTNDPRHELAHAWYSTSLFTELWLREGMADWTASAMAGASCAPALPNTLELELSDWQVVQPTSDAETYEENIAAQEAAACGIVSAVESRMSEDQWNEVVGSMLKGETKYIGSAGPEIGSSPVVDYREWLDAVDERGLVPAAEDAAYAANLDELDFAQDLLNEYGVPGTSNAPELARRSEARALYHQFLADAAPLGAPLAVRKDMDDWNFERAVSRINKSYEVLAALTEANDKLPSTDLLPVVQPDFEGAPDETSLDAVRERTLALLEGATAVFVPLGDLQAVVQSIGWGTPLAVDNAISEQRFDDIMTAIAPAIRAAQAVSDAHSALPQAGLLEKYQLRYENTATASGLNELAEEATAEAALAERAGSRLDTLEVKAGDWAIPEAVTRPIEQGQIKAGIAIIDDAIAVLDAATEADGALPEAGLRAETQPLFENVRTGAEMAALRADVQQRGVEAKAVGNALSTLATLVPTWQIPSVVDEPVQAGDFAAAAESAAAAQKWIEWAHAADRDLPQLEALARIKDDFEGATNLEELQAGAALAEEWAEAADYVRRAQEAAAAERGLLTDFGLWGVDVNPALEAAMAAALIGDVPEAISKSNEVISAINGGQSAGSLRLAGLVFFGVAVIGVLGLWVMLRRQSGPSWARSTKPHWVEGGDKNKRGLLGRGKKDDKK
jgi:hypothetical protein